MNSNKKYLLVMNAVSYIADLVVNILAQAKMLGMFTTEEISNKYINLFTPSGYTFSIWSLIYLLLGAYIIYQFITNDKSIVYFLAPYIFAVNILNIVWILCWHFSTPLISLIAILLLMIFLCLIVNELRHEKLLPKTTFTIYYAWITVATISSIFVFLTTLTTERYDSVWFVILTDVALAIVGLLMVIKGRNENFGYILTLLWATIGVFIRQITEFKAAYPSIVIISLVVIFVGFAQAMFMLVKRKSSQ